MPGIDGWETLRRCARQRLSDAPVAIVSANAFDKGLDNDVGIAAADFIVKPVRLDELLDWLGARLALQWQAAPARRRRRRRAPAAAGRGAAARVARATAGACSEVVQPGLLRAACMQPARRDRAGAPRAAAPGWRRCARWPRPSSSTRMTPWIRDAIAKPTLPEPAREPPGRTPADRANAGLVLIVDDVPDNLAVLHDALDEAGYTVLVATDGASALQRAAQAVPDIVLLDAVMPGMDGFEVARRLKAEPGDGAHPHHLHDRPDRDRARGGRASTPAASTT